MNPRDWTEVDPPHWFWRGVVTLLDVFLFLFGCVLIRFVRVGR